MTTHCQSCSDDNPEVCDRAAGVNACCECLCHRVIELERQIREIDRRIDTRIVHIVQRLGVYRDGYEPGDQ